MQIIYQNEDERKSSERTNAVDFVIYAREISRSLKEKYTGEFRSRNIRIYNNRKVFDRDKERGWWRRQRENQSGEVKS